MTTTAATLGASNQHDLAEAAFAEYDFGDGVMVTDTAGWEYTSPGHERSRKVYAETEAEDDGPAPRWTLTFTVRFDPATGNLTDAYAIDHKGQIWGSLPPKKPSRPLQPKADDQLASLVLAKLNAYARKPIQRREGAGYVIGVFPTNNRPVLVVDGDFGRNEFKAAIAEISQAQLASERFTVVARTATYSGQAIDFIKIEDLC